MKATDNYDLATTVTMLSGDNTNTKFGAILRGDKGNVLT
jgi:hypothetical protein